MELDTIAERDQGDTKIDNDDLHSRSAARHLSGTAQSPIMTDNSSLRIGFIHPDLGIGKSILAVARQLIFAHFDSSLFRIVAGGAERLVVDAAVSLQKRGHSIEVFTSRHDPERCFEETRDGTLRVSVLGNTFPRAIFGGLGILCAIVRQVHLTIMLLLSIAFGRRARFDVFVVDQLSVCVPLLRWFSHTRVVFYCHFPDKFLSGGRELDIQAASKGRSRNSQGLFKKLYRLPFDRLEEYTTGHSDIVLANSAFTARVYSAAFPSLAQKPHLRPRVVYPCINLESYNKQLDEIDDAAIKGIKSKRPTFISLNRFERKKNVALAIEAFKIYKEELAAGAKKGGVRPRLVIAGGYDSKLPDNVETLNHLRGLCFKHELSHATLDLNKHSSNGDVDVLFLLNFTTDQRTYLLLSSRAILYTPENEHFGIVPVEAMACGLPVIATDTGGPTETVLDGVTGYLRPLNARSWAECMATIASETTDSNKKMAEAAKRRAREEFGLDVLGAKLEGACVEAKRMGRVGVDDDFLLLAGAFGLMTFMGVFALLYQIPM